MPALDGGLRCRHPSQNACPNGIFPTDFGPIRFLRRFVSFSAGRHGNSCFFSDFDQYLVVAHRDFKAIAVEIQSITPLHSRCDRDRQRVALPAAARDSRSSVYWNGRIVAISDALHRAAHILPSNETDRKSCIVIG